MNDNFKSYYDTLKHSAIDCTAGLYAGQLMILSLIIEKLDEQLKDADETDYPRILANLIDWIKQNDVEVTAKLINYLQEKI